MRSGLTEGLPYSFSRYTDVPAAKWAWFQAALKAKKMLAFDPRTAIPSEWSLHPLRDYKVKVHVTVTGWHEVEKGAPSLQSGADKLAIAVDTFGSENVTWRFSPVPDVPDVVNRFSAILAMASHYGVKKVYLSFLQENDLLPETRSEQDRLNVLVQIAKAAQERKVRVYLCNEDRMLAGHRNAHPNLASAVCAPPEDFTLPSRDVPPSEGCGCVLMVDPFTVNEACSMGCLYCYARDQSLSAKKRNTTRLKVLPP